MLKLPGFGPNKKNIYQLSLFVRWALRDSFFLSLFVDLSIYLFIYLIEREKNQLCNVRRRFGRFDLSNVNVKMEIYVYDSEMIR